MSFMPRTKGRLCPRCKVLIDAGETTMRWKSIEVHAQVMRQRHLDQISMAYQGDHLIRMLGGQGFDSIDNARLVRHAWSRRPGKRARDGYSCTTFHILRRCKSLIALPCQSP